MKAITIVIGALIMTVLPQSLTADDSASSLTLVDYASKQGVLDWYVVNDNVMGGRSEGDFSLEQDDLHFSGSTNTRGGGFSSIRTRPVRLDLSAYDGVRVKVNADGRRYTWRITTDARWRGRQVSYWADFDTQDGTWSTVDIPFDAFIPQFRGMRLDGPALDPAKITGMGLMIYDKQDGPFDLRLSRVTTYVSEAP
ncbi:MAG: CIA30 family protein [Pseudomonadota bacterium]